jgi:hypothetical protein
VSTHAHFAYRHSSVLRSVRLFARGIAPASGHVDRVAGVCDHFPLVATLDMSGEEP